ncbi:MAG TPA: hemerythrin domain-containing protein [Thermoanaerobaculia bacterium]|nr:hemerythrin domain-containing protein [Thermoanaerobaculia bacterium]
MSQRVNLYREVHKGIRAMLSELLRQSGRVDFSDAEALAKFRAEAHGIFEMLESHAHHEDTFVMPVVREVALQVAQIIESAHVDQEAQLPELLALLDSIDSSAPDAAHRGHTFVVKLARISGELLLHMSDEEELIMPALHAAFTDDELNAIEQRLLASIPPEKMARFLGWMIPAINGSERVAMLAGMQAGAPAEVFAFVREIARKALTPHEDAALDRALLAVW